MKSGFNEKYQIICPECGVAVVTERLEAIVWERCPGCMRHIWDRYDVLMADKYVSDTGDAEHGFLGLQA